MQVQEDITGSTTPTALYPWKKTAMAVTEQLARLIAETTYKQLAVDAAPEPVSFRAKSNAFFALSTT
jgi:hypothetical protein